MAKELTRRRGIARVCLAAVLAITLTGAASVSQAQAARVLPLPRVTAQTYAINFHGKPAVVLQTLLVRRVHEKPSVTCNGCRRFATHKPVTSSPNPTSRRYRHVDWILRGGRAVKIKVTRRGWIGRYLLLTARHRKGRPGLGYKASGCLSRAGLKMRCPRGTPKPPPPNIIVVPVPVSPPTSPPASPPTTAPPLADQAAPPATYGPFNIRAAHSDKCLDVFEAKTADKVPVQQYQCLGPEQTNQQWYFTATGDGSTYYVKARHSDKCLDVLEAKTDDKVPVQQYQCLGYDHSNQRWYLTTTSIGGTFNIRAAHSGKCLDVFEAKTDNVVPVQQYQCLGASQTNQQWYLTDP